MTILIKRNQNDNVLLGHVGLPHVLPVIVHLEFFMLDLDLTGPDLDRDLELDNMKIVKTLNTESFLMGGVKERRVKS